MNQAPFFSVYFLPSVWRGRGVGTVCLRNTMTNQRTTKKVSKNAKMWSTIILETTCKITRGTIHYCTTIQWYSAGHDKQPGAHTLVVSYPRRTAFSHQKIRSTMGWALLCTIGITSTRTESLHLPNLTQASYAPDSAGLVIWDHMPIAARCARYKDFIIFTLVFCRFFFAFFLFFRAVLATQTLQS